MIQEKDQKRIITNEDLYNLIQDSALELKAVDQRLTHSIEELRKSTLDGFARVFEVIDEAKAELRTEFKSDISSLRKEMNQRFSIVDKKFDVIDGRLSGIEDNMVYKHQLAPKFA